MKINPLLVAVLGLITIATAISAQAHPPEPTLDIMVDHPVIKLGTNNPTHATVEVIPYHIPKEAKLTYQWKQVQDVMNPLAADMTKKKVGIVNADAAKTAILFPDYGVYELRVTVTDSEHHLVLGRNVWVNVWDKDSHILRDGKPDPLLLAPGLLPPAVVRHLSPDPGPFQHPRFLCTDADWKDIHDRSMEGKSVLATRGYKKVVSLVDQAFDPKTDVAKLFNQLLAYGQSKYQGPAPDLLMGEKDQKKAGAFLNKFLEALKFSAFKTWVKFDPALPLQAMEKADAEYLSQLNTVFAAFCHLQLANCWEPGTDKNPEGIFKKDYPGYFGNMEIPYSNITQQDLIDQITIAYDFLQSRMSDAEQREARNLLFAVGPGRQSSRGYGHENTRFVARGLSQNGTFSNFAESQTTAGLVVAGEESGADPRILGVFLPSTLPPFDEKHKGDTNRIIAAYDSLKYTGDESGWGGPLSHPYAESMSWPHARKVDVDNLQREIYHITDMGLSPWGFVGERESYSTFYTATVWPRALMYARMGGENQFVTSYYYHMINMLLNSVYTYGPVRKSDHFYSESNIFNHHAGNGDHRFIHTLLLKYMFPEDPAVDYIFASRAPGLESGLHLLPIETCLWGLDPIMNDTRNQMKSVAAAKEMPLTLFDPEQGVAVMRNSFNDNDLMVDFDDGFQNGGHMNAEKNSFSFFALGRGWSLGPGFHKVYSNWQSGIHFQIPAWTNCPITQGYVGENPCFKPWSDACDMPHNFPTPPGKFLEVTDGPDHQYTLVAGDATAAYNYICGGKDEQKVMLYRADYMYPGLLKDLTNRVSVAEDLFVNQINPYYGFKDKFAMPYPTTTVQHAIRSLLFVRGERPYLLVVDDFKKEDKPTNYRWMMGNRTRTELDYSGWPNKGELSMRMAPGATATNAVLLHKEDAEDKPGNARLLICDLSEADNSNQPPMRLDTTEFKAKPGEDFYLNEQTARLFIERKDVIEPKYKILLFPYRVGEKAPITEWNKEHDTLTIDLQNGTKDMIHFDTSNPDHRTRLTFQRSTEPPKKSS